MPEVIQDADIFATDGSHAKRQEIRLCLYMGLEG